MMQPEKLAVWAGPCVVETVVAVVAVWEGKVLAVVAEQADENCHQYVRGKSQCTGG